MSTLKGNCKSPKLTSVFVAAPPHVDGGSSSNMKEVISVLKHILFFLPLAAEAMAKIII